MTKRKSALIVLLLGLVTAVVVGALLITFFLPILIERFACAPYGIRCTIKQVTIRPRPDLTADLAIDYFTLFDPGSREAALRVKRLAATLNISALILTRQVMPTEVRIENPELLLRQLDDGRWNLVALAQEVQRHLQPAARPTTLQVPRVSLTGGAMQIGSRRITDMNVTLEPKPAPLLFEMQAQAAVGGRSVQLSGALKHTLEGQVRAQVREDRVRGAVRFHLDQPNRAVTIPEWSFEAEGALARGTAAIRYADWPPAYTLTVEQWRADLGVLANQFRLPWLSGLTGVMEGEPTTLEGRWPDLPAGQAAALFTAGGLTLSAQQVTIAELNGDLELQLEKRRLQGRIELRGKTIKFRGQGYDDPSLRASFSVDPTTGDVTADNLRASIAGARIGVKGTGRQWGRDSLDLTTTELRIEPALLAQLSRLAGGGLTVTQLADPSIRLSWQGDRRPWKVEMRSRSIRLQMAAADGAAALQNARIAVLGIGVSGRRLEGALAVDRIDLAGQRLRSLTAGFAVGPDRVRIPTFHMIAGEGDVRGHASLISTAAAQKIRMALSVRGLHPQLLSASTDTVADAQGVTLDTDLAIEATVGRSQPLTGGGAITLHGLSLNLARKQAMPASLVGRWYGSIPFVLDAASLTIPETTLRNEAEQMLILAGSLPVGGRAGRVMRARLAVPWTELSTFRPTLAALTKDPPEAIRLAGQLRTDAELIGQDYHATLALRNVSVESKGVRLDGVTGVIPLEGRTGSTGLQPVGRHSTGSADRASASGQFGRRRLAEGQFETALTQLSEAPATASGSLTVGSLRYDPIELRGIAVSLASSDGRIAVQRLAFDAWDGRWGGWGTIEPLGGGIALTILTDGLSLRAICDAFPPIKGYINGRINGMVELAIPRLAVDQAVGNARFWAIESSREKRKISRALIEKLAGQQIRYFNLFGVPRRYNRGVLEVALNAGDLVFHELEISHTVMGYKDLDVRVSPTFNKIGLTHLIETMREAIERIRTSAKPNH